MANLILMSLFSIITFIWAENVSNLVSMDDAVSTDTELPNKEAYNYNNVIAFLEDPCVMNVNTLRKVHDGFIYGLKNLRTARSIAIGDVGVAGSARVPIATVGEFALSITFLLDVINLEADNRDSPELEYIKCFKKEYDEFKMQMIMDMRKILKDIDDLRNELLKQFQEIQQNLEEFKYQIDELQKQIGKEFIEIKKFIFKIEELMEKDRIGEYEETGIEARRLSDNFLEYMESPSDKFKEDLRSKCSGSLNPRRALKHISETYLKYLFDLPSSNNYAVLLTRCKKILAGVINLLYVEMNCFALLEDKGDEMFTRKHWEKIEAESKNISDRMVAKLQEVKNYNVDHVFPAILKELIPIDNNIMNVASLFLVRFLKFLVV